MKLGCPLCRSERTSTLETVNTAVLAGLYDQQFGVDVRGEFGCVPTVSYVHCGECDLRFFHPAIVESEAFYGRLQAHDWYYVADKAEYGHAAQLIGSEDQVLEIGAGEGLFAGHIDPGGYVGLELSRKAAERASAKGVNVVVEAVEVHAREHAEAYDVVCAFQALEHMADPRSFLDAALRCLKPGGRLICAVPSEDSYIRWLPNAVLNIPPHHLTRWSDAALKQAGAILGVQVESIEHESLDAIHRPDYARARAWRLLNAWRIRKPPLIDVSATGRMLAKFAAMAAKFTARCGTGRARPRGHSATAVYGK